jgi:5'-deoxynucleotidase
MSHFFAYLFRMRFIKRWGLMHNTYPENVQEHSLRVAQIAHALAVIKNRLFDGDVDPDRVAVLALYHDASEVLIGDLPSPIKYFNPEIHKAYKEVEKSASKKLVAMVPEELADDYRSVLMSDGSEGPREPNKDEAHRDIVKAADKLCAYVKCLEETAAGNREFAKAEEALREAVEELEFPEVDYFMKTFVSSFKLTLDELG